MVHISSIFHCIVSLCNEKLRKYALAFPLISLRLLKSDRLIEAMRIWFKGKSADGIPPAKCLRQVSPRTTNPHSIQHSFYRHAQIAPVINGFLKQNLLQLRPKLIAEHQAGPRKLVLLVAQEPQYHELVYIYQTITEKYQQTLAKITNNTIAANNHFSCRVTVSQTL